MKGFNRCDKGHFYKEGLTLCPYCPENNVSNPFQGGLGDKTQIVGGGSDTNHNDKTQVFGTPQAGGGGDKTQVFGAPQAGGGGSRDLTKTFIGGGAETSEGGIVDPPRAARKITGWLVSYTIDPMGIDFRIYEGKNRIGKDPSLEITVASDSTVSGNHAVILYRSGVWYLEDEMSANGTFLNGEELAPRNPTKLADNDTVKVGNTTFKFKSAL